MSQNQNQNQGKKFGLLDRNADIEPIGVVYNVTGAAIEEFVYNYLTRLKEIDGVAAVRAHVIRDGSQRPEVTLYVFLQSNSKDVASNMGNIPDHIKKKMDEGSYRASEKLKKAMYPLCKELKIGVHPERLLYVKCDVFKTLGIMFAADPKVHSITIPEVVKLKKKNSIITVVKTNKFIDKEDASSFDKFSQIIERMEE